MRRTDAEVEKDYKRIRELLNVKKLTSIREIAEELNLSQIEVKTSLNHHPIVAKRVMETLKSNRKMQRGDERQRKKEETKVSETEKTTEIDFVIDASIMGHSDLKETIFEILKGKSMLIITSVTLKELEAMQKFKDKKALDTRQFLAEAVENPNKFKNVLIDETLSTPDDCIVEYCAENRNEIILLTADKTMVLKARMYGVEVRYLKHSLDSNACETLQTLKVAKCIDDKIIIDDFNKENCNIMVISQGLQYTEGIVELKIGDHVYVGWIQECNHSVLFEHYQIGILTSRDNSVLIYSRKIHSKKQIKTLPKSEYRNFMKSFFIRHDLF